MDRDVDKYVSVSRTGSMISVEVTYGGEYVYYSKKVHTLRASGPLMIKEGNLGVKVTYETEYLFGLLRWRRSKWF